MTNTDKIRFNIEAKRVGKLIAEGFMRGFNPEAFIDIPLTKEELRADGMTEKEIDIQEALGSTPTKSVLKKDIIFD